MKMTKEEILDVVEKRFCGECPGWNPAEGHNIMSCPHCGCEYYFTYHNLAKSLEKADKEVNK